MENKVKKTPAEILKKVFLILLIVVSSVAALCLILGAVSRIGVAKNLKFIENISPVAYENQLKPQYDENGYQVFITDDEFKIVQLTDVHIGGGFLSINKDAMAINAVAAMLTEEKPDLVVVTGDIVYPVPFQSGTFDNELGAKIFAELMEQLGVYWCPVLGNHDTETYTLYSRDEIGAFYESEEYKYCLFSKGPEQVDGIGNYAVNVKNTKGEITQSLIMIDSNSYVGDTFLSKMGVTRIYDSIHKNQIEWYGKTLNSFKDENGGKMPNSLAFFHIPIAEHKAAWDEYVTNDYKNCEHVKYIYGEAGERGPVVYPGNFNYGFFEKIQELGSTKGIFVGHDHLNNFALEYQGVRFTYGFAIDYLAYPGIKNYGIQRGCTVINVKPDGSFESYQENYYQDKYTPVNEKEDVTLDMGYYD